MGATTSRSAQTEQQSAQSTCSTQQEKLNQYGQRNAGSHRSVRLSGGNQTSRPQAQHDTSSGQVTVDALKAWDASALQDPTAQLAAMTLHNAPIKDSVRRRQAETADQHVFSHVIPEQGTPITNQKSSGRCWLFATTNVVRVQVIKTLNLKHFELSQSYLAFYDKLEKSNTFLENTIELADLPVDDRIFGFLKTAPTNDGGQWDMVTNLIKKYGLVPKSVFPESYNSSNSNQINWLLTLKLREFALELRKLKSLTEDALQAAGQHDKHANQQHVIRTLRARKDEQMAEVYRVMVIALGVPPKADDEFTFEYYDKNDKFHSLKSTPLQFLEKYTGSFDPAGACSLVNDPRRGYNKLMTVDRLQNVWGGQPVLYVNTTTNQMKDSVVKTIKAGLPVFFGCDVGQFSNGGIMDTAIYDYELPFGIKLGLSKADRIDMGESSMTHAMVITGVNLGEDGKPVRYRVENSWGDGVGDKGFMVMTDKWFDEFVYQVVIRKQHMPANLWKLFEDGVNQDTDVLPPYDPMGSLASRSDAQMSDTSGIADEHCESSSDDDPDRIFEVQLILDHRKNDYDPNKLEYLVAWVGYEARKNSWEPEEGLQNAKESIEFYWRHNAPGSGLTPSQQREFTRVLRGRVDYTLEQVLRLKKEEMMVVLRHIKHDRLLWSNWKTHVSRVFASGLQNGKRMFSVQFTDGFYFDYIVDVVRKNCPEKLLDFLLAEHQFGEDGSHDSQISRLGNEAGECDSPAASAPSSPWNQSLRLIHSGGNNTPNPTSL